MKTFLTFDCSGGNPRPLQYEHYQTEKDRKRLIDQAHQDARNSPTAQIWVIDVGNDVVTSPLGEIR